MFVLRTLYNSLIPSINSIVTNRYSFMRLSTKHFLLIDHIEDEMRLNQEPTSGVTFNVTEQSTVDDVLCGWILLKHHFFDNFNVCSLKHFLESDHSIKCHRTSVCHNRNLKTFGYKLLLT